MNRLEYLTDDRLQEIIDYYVEYGEITLELMELLDEKLRRNEIY